MQDISEMWFGRAIETPLPFPGTKRGFPLYSSLVPCKLSFIRLTALCESIAFLGIRLTAL